MMNFDTNAAISSTDTHIFRETVTIRPTKTHMLSDEWGWKELRDYVDHQMQLNFGKRDSRDAVVVSGICKSFVKRWGSAQSQEIARYAFETMGGMWLGKPVDFGRFTKNSDPYFASAIVSELRTKVAA